MNWTISFLNNSRNTFASAASMLLILFVLSSCSKRTSVEVEVSALPYYMDATFTPYWMSPDDSTLDDFHKISDFSLTNQEGETITKETLSDKIYIADFFFTICPGICPKMTANMALLQEEFKNDEDVMLLSHSVTPVRDSVPVLKAYADKKGIKSNKWHLLTGDRHEIYSLGRTDYFIEEDLGLERDIDEFLHTENFVLIDKNQHIRGIYNGLNKASLRQLVKDVKVLQEEGIDPKDNIEIAQLDGDQMSL